MANNPAGKVWFIGAGPGAADLITVRGAKAISEADIVVWARSLVSEEILGYASPDAEVVESTDIPLEGTAAVYRRAAREGLTVARIHSGDPAIFGAIMEQIERCEDLELDWEVVPGVSSFSAAAAAIGRELTIPEVSQSIILTRRASRTPMPRGQEIERFAAHGTTMAIFLSAARPRELQEELLSGGYPPHTPCAVVYRATWPDQKISRCRLEGLGDAIREMGVNRQAMILIGPGLDAYGRRSRLYDPEFSHMFRRGSSESIRDITEGIEAR
ncbi:precorrin-4 C(11)-methyltransferase [Rubrobacter indicoceani]|uniref:precorrin-4 C(11)-methyltransferase n=1 Tax=Rubrobacter indicoceani TaxID=2051957 RepID=UPI000E5B6496|nr:precorrin-4 C(11)-methyltransferase [Rubrobacter indicoceani]